jgi:hypothetical protein
MDIAELSAIESEEQVVFKLRPNGKFRVKGTDTAIAKALARITNRDEVAAVLRERDGDPEPVVEREIAIHVPDLEVQRANYVRWFQARPTYYHPTLAQLDVMMAACEEGDLLVFDFALSFSVIKPNGKVIAIDRRGRVTEPSPYSPALAQQGK